MDKSEQFRAITEEMAATYEAKNHDYGNSFDITFDILGAKPAAGRMLDKVFRFVKLMESESAVKDESVIDSLTDLANYAIMTRMYIESHMK